MQVHFISDLHLTVDRPALTAIFERYLAGPARDAEALYILGDLYEYWAGDDDHEDPLNDSLANQLAALAQNGTRIHFMPGNRDFLIGAEFARRARLDILPEPTLIRLGTQAVLLCHGDSLCTDDTAYQAFRAQVRTQAYQTQFLGQPLVARKQFIACIRQKSEAAKAGKSAEIMDANSDAIASLLRSHNYPLLIHGHTHRPARHQIEVDGHTCERWVLADWRESEGKAQGEVLVWADGVLSRQPLE